MYLEVVAVVALSINWAEDPNPERLECSNFSGSAVSGGFAACVPALTAA